MLLDCFASCTRCLSPRWESRAADKGKGLASVPVPTPAEVAPEDANGLEPPFQQDLCFFTYLGRRQTIKVTVDYSVPVNVVTNKCVVEVLAFPPTRRHALPPDLSKLAAKALLAHCGYVKLSLYLPGGEGPLSRARDFVVVGDDYRCDLLLGHDFLGVSLEPVLGFHPNFTTPVKSKEERERQERDKKAKQALQAEAAAERQRKSDEYLEQLRKQDPKSGDGAGEPSAA